MLPSSVDFKVELVPFALIDALKARAFDRTDVYKRIRLAIVTGQKAEALHRVEELDRSGRLLAGQFALRSNGPLLDRNHVANDLKVLRRYLPATINKIELKLLPFGKPFKACAFDSADVHENIFPAGFLLDEAEALLCVEEFYDALAGSDDLSGHTVETAACTTAAARSATTTATTAAATAESVTAATKTISPAETVTAATPTVIAEAITTEILGRRESVTSAKWIEAVFTETVALVPTPAAPSIVTHSAIRTLSRRPLPSMLRQCGRQPHRAR